MYEYRCFTIYENALFSPFLISVWNVKRDNEIVFHSDSIKRVNPDNYFCIIRTVSGKAKLLMKNGTRLTLWNQTLIVLQENQILSYEADGGVWEYYFYNFISDTDIPYFETGKLYELQILDQERLLNDEIFNVMNIYNNINSNFASAIFHELFFRWIYSYTKSQYDSVYYKEIQAILQYINTHLNENPSITELAEKCNFSVRHFRHVFTEIVGVSPKNYITERRFAKACLLLKTSTTSISEIAQELGYYSQFQFSRDFKNQFGITPSEYRREKK